MRVRSYFSGDSLSDLRVYVYEYVLEASCSTEEVETNAIYRRVHEYMYEYMYNASRVE